MTQLHPPATLYKKGNDYIVEAYTQRKVPRIGYGLSESESEEYEKACEIREASKVTLTVHKDSIKNILDFVGDLPFNDETAISYFSKLDMKDFHQTLTRGIDISRLLPRLEVRDGFVFLKPEQPVNEAEESWDDVLTNMIEHVGYCITNYDGARKYFEANYLPPKAKK